MTTIRELMAKRKFIWYPLAFDALSALMIERAGYDIVWIGGLLYSGVQLGYPDFGLQTSTEIVRATSSICRVVDIPVIVDVDHGFGDDKNVRRLVQDLEAVGASGIQLEDQTSPRKGGPMAQKKVVPVEEYLVKLRAAVDTRRSKNFIIVGRTDCMVSLGLEEVIRRLNVFADNGADLGMSAHPHSYDEWRRLVKEVKIPLVGIPPKYHDPTVYTVQQWENIGVKFVEVPYFMIFAAMKAIDKVLEMFKTTGSVQAMEGDFFTYDEYLQVVKANKWMPGEEAHGLWEKME